MLSSAGGCGSLFTHLVTPGWGAPQRGRSWDDGNPQPGSSRVQRLHEECVVLHARRCERAEGKRPPAKRTAREGQGSTIW